MINKDINDTQAGIAALKREHASLEAELTAESKMYANGRNTGHDAHLEGAARDFIGVNQERRRVQDDGDEIPEDWIAASKAFLDDQYNDFKVGENEKDRDGRIEDLMRQIHNTNMAIEALLAEMQRIEREKGVSKQKGILADDMNKDMSDLRSRLEEQLSKREQIISEIKEYMILHKEKADLFRRQQEEISILLSEIEEIRMYLREEVNLGLEQLNIDIEAHKERLRQLILDINEVRLLITEEEHHNEIKRNLLRNKDEYIERLKIAIEELNRKPVKATQYIVTPGDDIDAIMAEKNGCLWYQYSINQTWWRILPIWYQKDFR
jgi:DNA repair exonuclease SbcCD ATPase subunit